MLCDGLQITDEGIGALASHCPDLRTLNLHSCNVSIVTSCQISLLLNVLEAYCLSLVISAEIFCLWSHRLSGQEREVQNAVVEY